MRASFWVDPRLAASDGPLRVPKRPEALLSKTEVAVELELASIVAVITVVIQHAFPLKQWDRKLNHVINEAYVASLTYSIGRKPGSGMTLMLPYCLYILLPPQRAQHLRTNQKSS